MPSVGPIPSRSAADLDGLPERLGRYQLIERLGKGGMGAVYLAFDPELHRHVALKVPHLSLQGNPKALEWFQREARTAAQLHHPNLCPVYDVGTVGDRHYFTMRYVEGTPLADRLGGGQQWQEPRAAAVLVQKLASALAYAHRLGVIHRDLKPANILLGEGDEPVVMDFGVAYRAEADGRRLTRPGQILGTPAYMSPEQARGDLDAMGAGCDVYSLGVILYELLTGRAPFEGTDENIYYAIRYLEPRPPSALRPGLDQRLDGICLKAMAKRPEDRFHCMEEMAAALEEYRWVQQAGDLKNSVGMKLVRIRQGKFLMGSPLAEKNRRGDEQPHEVEITRDFYLGVHEVTQKQYCDVMCTNPSYFCATGDGKARVAGPQTDDFPVECVSWEDACKFCKRLSALPQEKTAGRQYRLPTEAEWEYACRAGTRTAFHGGDSLDSHQANFIGDFPGGEATKGPNRQSTSRVGDYPANAWGLKDMHGNVLEWCLDRYGAYGAGPAVDPTGPPRGDVRVVRGGSWALRGQNCRAAARAWCPPSFRGKQVGFRVVCVVAAAAD